MKLFVLLLATTSLHASTIYLYNVSESVTTDCLGACAIQDMSVQQLDPAKATLLAAQISFSWLGQQPEPQSLELSVAGIQGVWSNFMGTWWLHGGGTVGMVDSLAFVGTGTTALPITLSSISQQNLNGDLSVSISEIGDPVVPVITRSAATSVVPEPRWIAFMLLVVILPATALLRLHVGGGRDCSAWQQVP